MMPLAYAEHRVVAAQSVPAVVPAADSSSLRSGALLGHLKPLDRYAAYAEAEALRDLEQNKRALYSTKLPLAGILGTMSYLLHTTLDKSTRLVKDFSTLLNAQASVYEEIGRLYQEAVQHGQQMPAELNESLSQLRDSLKRGNPPHLVMDYMHRVRNASAGHVQTSLLDSHMQAYSQSIERILKNKAGLQAVAKEPMILKRLGMTKMSAQRLASHDSTGFLEALFQNILSDKDFGRLGKVFSRLGQVHGRIARLVAFGVSTAVGGYFIIDNERKTNEIIQRAS